MQKDTFFYEPSHIEVSFVVFQNCTVPDTVAKMHLANGLWALTALSLASASRIFPRQNSTDVEASLSAESYPVCPTTTVTSLATTTEFETTTEFDTTTEIQTTTETETEKTTETTTETTSVTCTV